MTDKELCTLAVEAMKSAYAPYSGFCVGAALLTASGKVYLGANIENAAYSPSVCAERVAIFKAVFDGEREFSAIAVCGGKNGEIGGLFPPCGVCRQVLAEFASPDLPVLMIDSPTTWKKAALSEILPYSFTPKQLQE